MGINLKLRDRAGLTSLLWMMLGFMNMFTFYAHSDWLIGDGSFFSYFIIKMRGIMFIYSNKDFKIEIVTD